MVFSNRAYWCGEFHRTLRSSIISSMTERQSTLFDKRSFKGQKPQGYSITPASSDMTVHATLPAYHAYLSSGAYSKYTPDDFTADLKRFGQFTATKPLKDIQTVDIQQWIGQLKTSMPPKSVSRKVSAVGNYFRWLEGEKVLERNPAQNIRAPKVIAPLPDILFENECEQLLKTAGTNPRTYLLVLLLLETGIKKAELLELAVNDFDLSNKYQPELWIKHEGKQVLKDRRVKLPMHATDVLNDYVAQYNVTDVLFPYTPRSIEQLLTTTAKEAGITKAVTPSILRDVHVVRSIRRGGREDEVFERIGLAKSGWDDARKKYRRLTKEAL